MAFEVGSIMARLQLDSSGYTRGILNAQSMNAVFGNSVTQFINNPLLGTIGILRNAVTSVVRWSGAVLSNAEAMTRLADQTGLTTNTVQALRAEFEQAGRPITQADQAMRTFNTRLQQARTIGGPVAEVFNRIGVSTDGMRSTNEVFVETLAALGKYESVAQAGAVAAQLFGEEAGGAMAETINAGGGLDEIISKMTDFGRVTDEQALRKMAELNTRMGELQQATAGVRQSLTTDFLSVLFDGFEDMDTEEIAKFTRQLREDLKPTVEGLAEAIRKTAEAIKFLQDVGDGMSDWVAALISPEVGSAAANTQINNELARMQAEAVTRRAARNAERRELGLTEVMPGR